AFGRVSAPVVVPPLAGQDAFWAFVANAMPQGNRAPSPPLTTTGTGAASDRTGQPWSASRESPRHDRRTPAAPAALAGAGSASVAADLRLDARAAADSPTPPAERDSSFALRADPPQSGQ